MSAALEVERALEGGAAAHKASSGKPADLTFSDFHLRLIDLNIAWLSMEQQRVIFDTIDADHSGCITEKELSEVAIVRQRLEAERAEELAAERAELEAAEAAAKAEAAAQAENE